MLAADNLLGPYAIVRTGLRPLGMSAGDFDLCAAPDGKGYYFFEWVHSETIIADLTDDYCGVTGYYSTHFPQAGPPYVREATAHFVRKGKHYLITSGTTGYFSNPSQAAACGISHVFAPVLDVAREPRFGRMNESYGEDETLAAPLGTALTKGLQSNAGVEAVAKHFLAFHQGAGGLHGADVSVGERELLEVYAKPFAAAIALAGLKGVMPCYNFVNGELVSFSKRYLTDLLRAQLGFDGLAVSDYCAIMNGVTVNRAAENACEAGWRPCLRGWMWSSSFPTDSGTNSKKNSRGGRRTLPFSTPPYCACLKPNSARGCSSIRLQRKELCACFFPNRRESFPSDRRQSRSCY